MPVFKKVLLIDEDATNNLIFRKLAASTKLAEDLEIYISALDALEYLNNCVKTSDTLPEIIFLDIRMPIMSGWEFLEEYQKIKASFNTEIKIFILSTSNNPNDFEKAKKYSDVKKYLVKPLSIKTLKGISNEYA